MKTVQLTPYQGLDAIIHKELIPIQQAFKSYEELAKSGSYRFDPKIFRKCAAKLQEVINIARDLAGKEIK
jgi:hypothetical protein